MISIIICSINPVSFTRVCANYRSLLGAEPYEVIGIHDAKGLAEAYNRGLAQSKGDIVIFCHDDIEIWTPEFLPRLKHHLQTFDVIGVAGTSRLVGAGWHSAGPPYIFGQITHPLKGDFHVGFYGGQGNAAVGGIQAMDGVFLAFKRNVIQHVGWDAENFKGFHCYDIDCTYRAHKLGYKLGVVLDLPMFHVSGGNFGDTWKAHAAIFLQKHGATLSTAPWVTFRDAFTQVATREQALELMHRYAKLPS